MRSLATTIYSRIMCNVHVPYSEKTIGYLNSDGFVSRNQSTYLSRLDGLTPADDFRYKDIRGSYERLKDNGYVDEFPKLFIGWLPLTSSSSVGHSSALMRSVCLSRKLDTPLVDDELLDFSLYTQVAFISLKYGIDPVVRDKAFMKKVESYPNSSELQEQLECLGMSVTKDLSPEC